MAASVEKNIRLSPERARHLARLAQTHHLSEEQIIGKALDVLFGLTDFLDAPVANTSPAQSEETLRRHLCEAGLLTPPQAPPPSEPARDRTPIKVSGQPLSESIIEERR